MTTKLRYRIIYILVGLFAAWVGTMLLFRFTQNPQPRKAATATITYFGPGLSRLGAGMITVVAKTPEGISGRDVVSAERFAKAGCQMNDEVDGTVRGNTLTFDALSCRRPTQTPR